MVHTCNSSSQRVEAGTTTTTTKNHKFKVILSYSVSSCLAWDKRDLVSKQASQPASKQNLLPRVGAGEGGRSGLALGLGCVCTRQPTDASNPCLQHTQSRGLGWKIPRLQVLLSLGRRGKTGGSSKKGFIKGHSKSCIPGPCLGT